jgi:outer membrane protein OmpA-like peptidoglycan-associated protein
VYKRQEFNSDIIFFGPSATLNYKLSENVYPYLGMGIQNLWYKDFTSLNLIPEFGIRLLISKYFAIHGNLTMNFATEDNLDNLPIDKSNNDFFTTLSIGISYAVDLTIKNDIDEDGILNSNDECPEQKEDFDGFEDEDGCPEFDNDGDGIVDTKDNCINESEDFDGFEDDDGCPDLDNDGDGIMDIEDNCPDLKEDMDNFNDLDGCPDLDNDNDGLVDENDECPDHPETFNNYQDFDGCPDELPETSISAEEKQDVPIVEDNIIPEKKLRIAIPNEFLLEGDKLFENGSASIKQSAYKQLNSIADQMKNNIDFRWRIEGHLDNSGNFQELKILSTRRANAVKNYLVSKGLPAQLFQTIGLGDEVPIAPNSTIQGKLKNRRIIIKRIR